MTIDEILTPEAVTSDRMVPMPDKLPSCLELTTRLASPIIRVAVAKGQFAAMGSLMKRAWFVYVDGDIHEAHFNICTVGPSGVGKQQVSQINDCWLLPLREHDKPVQERIDKYNEDCNKAGDSGKKPNEPKGSDAALYILSNSITDPALLKNAKALEADGDGRANLNLNELDLLDKVFCNHTNAGQRIIAQFTSDEISAQRATAKGVSGRAKLRLNISVSTVEENVCLYFKKKDFFDGVTNRMDFSLIQRPPRSERRKIPKHGNFKDPLFLDKLKVYQQRLMEARGEIAVPKCDKLVERLADKTADLCDLYDLDVFEDATHRALVYAWLRGCVLYVAEGMKWNKRIEEFVIWSYWYSLWSYAHVFTPYFKTVRLGISKQDLRQYYVKGRIAHGVLYDHENKEICHTLENIERDRITDFMHCLCPGEYELDLTMLGIGAGAYGNNSFRILVGEEHPSPYVRDCLLHSPTTYLKVAKRIHQYERRHRGKRITLVIE